MQLAPTKDRDQLFQKSPTPVSEAHLERRRDQGRQYVGRLILFDDWDDTEENLTKFSGIGPIQTNFGCMVNRWCAQDYLSRLLIES